MSMYRRSSFIFYFFIRFIIGGVFIWAGAIKVLDPFSFFEAVKAYDIIPDYMLIPFALHIPWIEVICGISLLLGFWTRSSGFIILLLLLSFLTALGVNISRGADFSCGCFGIEGQYSLHWAFVQDMILIVFSVLILKKNTTPLSLDNFIQKRIGALSS